MPIQEISSVYGKIKYMELLSLISEHEEEDCHILSNTHSNTSP